MRYYVVADPHGFYSELVSALRNKGFFDDVIPHKLIICGDLLDRGGETLKMQEFVLDLLAKEQVVFVRGNHEDLMLSLLADWDKRSFELRHHLHNGTVDTVLQMAGEPAVTPENRANILKIARSSAFVSQIIPKTVDYFETEHYVFVHGWIPCVRTQIAPTKYLNRKIEDWRNAGSDDWREARWINGMDAWLQGVREPGKTIVCGHFHCSYGHSQIENKGCEFGDDADFEPFAADGILAIDACTAVSKKVNCIVIED